MLSVEENDVDFDMKPCDWDSDNLMTESESSKQNFIPEASAAATSCLRQSVNNSNVPGSDSTTSSFEFEDVKETVKESHSQRKDHLARADICRVNRRPELVINKWKIKEQFGFDVRSATFLWPEEVLYLMETGKLELYCDKIALSVQRARSIFLHSNSQPESINANIRSCDIDEYSVYKHLTKMGYRVKRRSERNCIHNTKTAKAPITISETVDDDEIIQGLNFENEEVVYMDPSETEMTPVVENTIQIKFPNPKQNFGNSLDDNLSPGSGKIYNPLFGAVGSQSRRGMKRKASLDLLSDDDSSNSSHQSFKHDADKYYVEIVTKIDEREEELDPFEIDSSIHTAEEMMEGRMDSDSEPIAGPSSATFASVDLRGSTSYIVSEVDSDSDVEIVEEVIHSRTGVSIEEVTGTDYEGDCEFEESGGTTGATGYTKTEPGNLSKVMVDLVSSDSEPEEGERYDYNILSTFVPNAKIRIGFPPSYLLPLNIPTRPDKVYEVDLKNKEAKPMDLENIVEDLNLASPKVKPEERVNCNSWKEWRQLAMAEARDVLNESLLASSQTAGVFKKLHLWEDNFTEDSCDGLRVPFDLYPPSVGAVGKHKLGHEISPSFHIAIVKNDEEVLKFSNTGSVGDEIPFLFAIVSDECDPIFVTSNLSPLPTLF